jgi:hypothetical protein
MGKKKEAGKQRQVRKTTHSEEICLWELRTAFIGEVSQFASAVGSKSNAEKKKTIILSDVLTFK